MQTRTSIVHAAGLVLVIAGVAVAAACGGAVERPSGSGTTTGPGTAEPPPLGTGTGPAPGPTTPPPTPVPDWSDAQALAWLNLNCAGCHGIDATGVQQLYYRQWPMPAGGVGKSDLETSDQTPVAYQTILNRYLDADGHLDGISPSPMPVKKPNAADIQDLRSMLAWFDRVLPLAVAEADLVYGNDTSSKPKVVINFMCSKPSTLRHHMGRFFLAALDRPPTPAELARYTTAELDAPVTAAQRLALATLLETTQKAEFLDSGLRQLALLIGSGPDAARPPAGLSAAAVTDLREELYQIMKAKYDALDYDKLFAENTVMVSANTAALYAGCSAPAAGTWKACALQPPRNGYFTTVGYLASLPGSFLDESNNYDRAAGLSGVLYGTPQSKMMSGPSGETVPPLPTCLEPTDTRAYQTAPRGAAAIPMFGKICQSCHLGRGLAAGSIVLRPFSSNGSVFDPATLGTPGSPDFDAYTAQTTSGGAKHDWQYCAGAGCSAAPQVLTNVDGAFLRSLLTASLTAPAACLPKPGTNTYTSVKSIADLAAILTADRIGVARGFVRYAQRAFSYSPTVPFEMIYHAAQVYDGPTHRIPDLVRAYFMSDTLACEGP